MQRYEIVQQRFHAVQNISVVKGKFASTLAPTVRQQLNSGAEEALAGSPHIAPLRKFINDKFTLHDMSVISFPQSSPRTREIITLRLRN